MDNPYNRNLICFCPLCEKEFVIRGAISAPKDHKDRYVTACRNHPVEMRRTSFIQARKFIREEDLKRFGY